MAKNSKIGRNVRKYGKHNGESKRPHTKGKNGRQSAFTFSAGSAAQRPHASDKFRIMRVGKVEVAIVSSATHSFLADVPVSWVR